MPLSILPKCLIFFLCVGNFLLLKSAAEIRHGCGWWRSHNNEELCQTRITADIYLYSLRITTAKWALNTHLMMIYCKQACPITPRPVPLWWWGDICMSASAKGPVVPITAHHCHPPHLQTCSVRCILKALWKQLNVRLMAKSWQNDCTIELAVMIAHITRWSKRNYPGRFPSSSSQVLQRGVT